MTAPVTPFSPIGEQLDNIIANIERLNLPKPERNGHILVFPSRQAANAPTAYGLYVLSDDELDEWEIDDGLTRTEAFVGLSRFTVVWKTEAVAR